jgi:hypothetical protein
MTELKSAAQAEELLAEVKVRRSRPLTDHTFLYAQVAKDRRDFVRQYRADPRPWPDGPGAWYRAQDWGDHGLIATGRAAAMALDPWASDRLRGYVTDPVTAERLPVPPLCFEGIEYPDVEPEPVSNALDCETENPPLLDTPETENPAPQSNALDNATKASGFDKKAYQRDLMRERRAALKAGLSLEAYRARQAAEASP